MSIVSTFLAPYKMYVYGAFGALLLGVFGWYTIHERDIGEAKIEKKDAALRAAAVALNVASQNLADIKELNIGQVYEKYVTLPPVADTGLVCHAAAAPAAEPAAAVSGPKDSSSPDVVPAGSFDPSGPILTLLRDDDAQINALIDTVLNLEAELQGQTK